MVQGIIVAIVAPLALSLWLKLWVDNTAPYPPLDEQKIGERTTGVAVERLISMLHRSFHEHVRRSDETRH